MDHDLDELITGISRLKIWMNYNDLTLISPCKRRFRSGSIFINFGPPFGWGEFHTGWMELDRI